MESEQLETEGKASKWEQALQRLEITPEQRLVIENAKAKEADDWSLEEADLIMRVSREARRLQAVDEYKALPQDDREKVKGARLNKSSYNQPIQSAERCPCQPSACSTEFSLP